MRFIINVSGFGGKFSLMPLTMTLGGGLGLMSISVIIAELVMLHCTKEKKLYQKMKTDKLDAEEDENNANDEFSESKDIPKFPTLPHMNELIALNTKSVDIFDSTDVDKKNSILPKSNGCYIQKV